MCSVRHRPIPLAPRTRARCASSGVSALARTPSRRRSSAWVISRWTALDDLALRPRTCLRGSSPCSAPTTALGTTGTSPRNTSPVPPSMEMTSPSLTRTPSPRGELTRRVVDPQRLGADDAGAAHAAGNDGRVDCLATPAGQDALGSDHSAQVVGVGLPADQDDGLAPVGPVRGPLRVEDGLADGGAGTRGHAFADQLARGLRVELREQQHGELVAGDPRSASSSSMSPSSTSCPAIRNAAAAVRLPTRVCSIHSLPRSIGELDVAQVLVVPLQRRHDLQRAGRRTSCPAARARPESSVLRMPATTSSPCAFGR